MYMHFRSKGYNQPHLWSDSIFDPAIKHETSRHVSGWPINTVEFAQIQPFLRIPFSNIPSFEYKYHSNILFHCIESHKMLIR